jgi:hypothetical protein
MPPGTDPRAILDIPTPPEAHCFKALLNKSSRRLFSRIRLGLSLPGRYYFCTWTSSPQSPPVKKSWRLLRIRLHRIRPLASFCYCLTHEGYGVIHMVIRLGKGEKRLDAKIERAYWVSTHQAKQIKFKYVPESQKNNLAAYLCDQRKKNKLGAELAWQDKKIFWNWSKGWLPKGFTRAFGRAWVHWLDAPEYIGRIVIYDWLKRCDLDQANVMRMPRIEVKNEC